MGFEAEFYSSIVMFMVYLSFLATTIFESRYNKKNAFDLSAVVITCILHLVVLVWSDWVIEKNGSAFAEWLLCVLYPLLGYLELYYYTRLFIKSCGATEKLTRAIRFYNHATVTAGFIMVLAMCPTKLLFWVEEGPKYHRGELFYLTYLPVVVGIFTNFVLTYIAKPPLRKKIGYIAFSVLPLVACLIMMLIPRNISIITDLSTLISCAILFSFVYMDEKKNALEKELLANRYKTDVMLSQIRPHFIYNTLSTISALCTIDPQKAETLTTDFADYLRTNLNLAKSEQLNSFEDELNHIKQYLSIEKVRFGDKLNVVYDIETIDFLLPTLSLQTLVENAVKHGITQRIEGGTITISAHKKGSNIVLVVADDGVGFDATHIKEKEGHYGLFTTKDRIKLLQNGSLDIKSKIDVGTTITINIPIKGEILK